MNQTMGSAAISRAAVLEGPEPQLERVGYSEGPRSISVCDTQPVTAEGIRTLLGNTPELGFGEATDSLKRALEHVRNDRPDVLLLDKAFGIQAILDWLSDLRAVEMSGATITTSIVIWGVSVTEAEALRFLQAGAKGILR